MEFSLKMEKFAFDGNDSVLFPVNPSFHENLAPIVILIFHSFPCRMKVFYLCLLENYFHHFDNKNKK